MMNGNMMGDSNEKIEWEDDMTMMNAMSTNKTLKWKLVDNETQKENMDINWQFKKGDKVKIKLFNDPKSEHPMQHPIHIHGQRFLITSVNDIQSQNLVWKDTVLVQNGDTVELLVDMENPGDWLIHCHIPEHMESGMMSKFEVKKKPA
jgi:FtsP/CotA-like multicopper oxidase with cupredoxin domain